MNTLHRARRAPAMPILVAMTLLLACALSAQESAQVTPDSGPGFQTSPKDSIRITDATPKTKPSASVSVTTNVPKAEVYIDGVWCGLTPSVIDGVAPGIRRLEIRKDGYYRKAWFIRIEAGASATVYAELTLVTGFLSVTGLPPDGVILTENKSWDQNRIELPAGLRTITLRAFGYDDRIETVLIEPRKETTVPANLAKATFNVKDLRVSRAAFNPGNPEGLGAVDIFFSVTAPGSGTLTISGENGETVFAAKLGPFETWSQSARWNGKDSVGKTADDGRYAIRIDANSQSAEAGAENNSGTITLSSTVTVDQSITYPMTGSLSGTGAVGPVIAAALMPAGGAFVRTEIGGGENLLAFGISVTAGLVKHVEAGFEAGAVRSDYGDGKTSTATALAAAVKYGGTTGKLSFAGALRYSALAGTEQTTTVADGTRRGLAIGPAIEYSMGPVIAGANAELQYGDARGLFGKPYLTAETGIAIRASGGILSGGIFAGAQTPPLAGGEARSGENLSCFSAGAFAHALVPTTSIVVSARAEVEWSQGGRVTPSFAGGFGFIF